MINLNDYIVEKLHLNKDIDVTSTPEEGDRIMAIVFLSGEKDCVLKVGIVKSLFRNTIIVKYDTESVGVKTMFVNTPGEDYVGKSEDGDLLFDKETALKLVNDCLKKTNREIYKNCNVVGGLDVNEYLNQIKDSLEEDVN
ncbi:MAG: hypothetical protein IJH39_04465 [Clostridia bacterium]|nr:hypothetical protein [Clostridia bacterium]